MKRSICIIYILCHSIVYGDWLNFRGNLSNGSISFDPEIKFEQNIDKSWKTKLPGRGLSSPILVDDKIFLTACTGPKQETLHVLCFAEDDGSMIWQRKFQATGRTICHEKTCVAAPTMCSDGDKVIAQFSSNDIFCLNLSGDLLWLRGLTYDFPNAANGLGMSSSPLITNGILIAQVENDAYSFTTGLDLKNGTTIWKKERPKAANWTSPVLVKKAGLSCILLQSKEGVSIIDPKDGEELSFFDGGASTIPSSTPSENILLVPSNGMTALKISKPNNSLTELWNDNKLGPGTASPSISRNRFLVINKANVLSCANIESGEILWRKRMKGPFSGSMIATPKHLYLFNEEGLGQKVSLNDDGGEVISSIQLNETILCTPAISNKGLYIRSDKNLWKFPAN